MAALRSLVRGLERDRQLDLADAAALDVVPAGLVDVAAAELDFAEPVGVGQGLARRTDEIAVAALERRLRQLERVDAATADDGRPVSCCAHGGAYRGREREVAPEGTAPRIDPEDSRVIRFRTFSKAYGMAGARVAYSISAEPLATAFNKVRNHFGVNRIAQIGALASLADEGWIPHVRRLVAEARDRIAAMAYEGVAMTYRSNGKGDMAHDAVIVCYDGASRQARVAKRYKGLDQAR